MSVHHNETEHRFELPIDGQTAVAQYTIDGKVITLTHTEVPAAHRGQGVADELAEAALEYARASGLRVVPRCPFMARWLRRHPEYRSLTDRGTGAA